MLIECNGITKDTFYIPPFSVGPGEVVVVFLSGGPHYYHLASWLTNIFTGKITHPQVIIHQPLQPVEYSRKRAFKNLFLPVTIKDYLKKHSGPDKNAAARIYSLGYLDEKTRVNTLNGDRRKALCVYTALSHSKNITLYMGGIDPLGAERIFNIVKENALTGGAALILDNAPDFKNNCTKFIELKSVT